MQDITFNDLSLNEPWILVNQVRGIDDQDDGDIQALRLSRGDGRTFQDKKFNGRTITITLTILGSNMGDFQAKLDTIKRAFYSQVRGILNIPYAGQRRAWVATTESVSMPGTLGRGFTQQVVITLLTEGFGFDLQDSEQLFSNKKSGDLVTKDEDMFLTNFGSYYALPIIIIDIAEFTQVSNLRIENLTLNQELNILPPPDYSNEDITTPFTVTIDSSQARVFWVGEDKRTSGVFPFLWVGDNSFRVSVSGDKMLFSTRFRYKKRYL